MHLRTTQQHATPLNPVQTHWNFVDEFGIAGNPNKGHSVSSQLDQTETWQCHHIPSIFASLSHGRYSRSRARVALGREVQLPMSFPWPVFPGLDQDLFPPWFSSFFGIRFQNSAFSYWSATFRFLFWIYFSCGFSAVAFSLNFSIYVVGSPLACPLGRLGPFPHPLVSLVSANHATTLNLVQTPWNFVAEFGIAGNPNKGYSVCSQLNQTEP